MLTTQLRQYSKHGGCEFFPQDNEVSSGDGVNKFQPGKEEEEEDKEQCSPVSVLDPPFDDDDAFDLDCSYANVQSTLLF